MKVRVVLLGPPASGKGTQAARLAEATGLPPVSTGAILRAEMRAGTELGRRVSNVAPGGALAPDELILEVVERWLAENDGRFIFDGFPRTVGQAEAFEKLLARRGTPLETVLFIDVSGGTVRERVLARVICVGCGHPFRLGREIGSVEERCPRCGGELERRSDDTEEALEKRMVQYREWTEPLVPYYEDRGLLRRIDGNREEAEVYADLEAEVMGGAR